MITLNDWVINIENAARRANEEYGFDIATSVFRKYGANSLDELNNCYYDSVFNELEMMAAD